MLDSLQYRMRVWVILSAAEEAKYLEFQRKSPLPAVMPVGEEITIDGIVKYVHHIDDHGGWEADPVLHPHFKPGVKPPEEDWNCSFRHDYTLCLCHLELREYGQDESIYRSGTT